MFRKNRPNLNNDHLLMKPRISLIICTTPRSGSSFLGRAVELTEVMGNPAEWLHPVNLSDTQRLLGYRPNASMDLLLRGTVDHLTATNGVFALKVMWTQLETALTELRRGNSDFRYKRDVEIISQYFPNPYFIYLTRRDLVAQAMSFCRENLSNKLLDCGQKSKSSDGSEFEFNFLSFNHSLFRLREDNREWRSFLSACGRPVLELEYEQIMRDYRGTLESIVAFLGIDEELSIDPAQNRLPKMTDANTTRWTREYERLLASIEEAERKGKLVPNPPDAFVAEITRLKAPETVRPFEVFQVGLHIGNRSGHIWSAVGEADGKLWNCVTLSWYQGSERVSGQGEFAAPLPCEIAPGESAPINLPIVAPDRPGTYQLKIDFDQTGVDRPRPGVGESAVLTVEVRRDRRVTEALLHFREKDVDPEGWIWTDWLGSIRTGEFPWIYSTRFGWLFCQNRSPEKKDYWFFREDLGWFWTNRTSSPFFWIAKTEEWLHCETIRPDRTDFSASRPLQP